MESTKLKWGLFFILKATVAVVFAVLAGIGIGWGMERALPSVTFTTSEPKMEEFYGRYLPLPDTARFLSKHYPGAQTWLDFKQDGSFEWNALPDNGAGDHATWSMHGTWKFGAFRRIRLLNSNEQALPVDLKGQKPPYLLEVWDEKDHGVMQFSTDPAPAIRAYAIVSTVDWIFQGLMAGSIFVLPFLLPKRSRIPVFGYPFLLMILWGSWRIDYYDMVTSDDIPGMGYIVIAFIYPCVAVAIFSIRRTITNRRQNRMAPQQVPA